MVAASGRSLYLLVGKERFLKQEFIRCLRLKFFPKGSDPANFQEFRSGENSPGELLDFLRTAPFLAEKRMAVLQEVEALSQGEKNIFLAGTASLPSTAVLVAVAQEGTPKKDPFLKELSLRGTLVPCYLPKETELPGWIKIRAEKKGLKLPMNVCGFLAERIGEDAASLEQAIEQLALKVSPRSAAELKDAEALFGRSLPQSLFGFMEILLMKNAPAALRSFESLFDEGTDPAEILPLLASQVDRLRRARSFIELGWPEAEIAGQLKIHPYYLRDTIKQASSLSEERAGGLLKKLLTCEEAIKTGQSAPRIAFERFVAEVCV